MDINFKFSNLLGAVFKNGNVLFSRDGNSVISPVGNKISIFDLKNNVSRTLSVESIYNITSISVNEMCSHLVLANEVNEILYVNMLTETVVYRFRVNRAVNDIKFSSDAQHCAMTRGGDLQLHEVSSSGGCTFTPFLLRSSIQMSTSDLTCIDWSSDSRLVVAGCEDTQIRIVGSKKICNVVVYAVAAHKAELVAVHFIKPTYDVVSIDRRGFANVWKCNLTEEDIVYGNYDKNDDVKKMRYEKEARANVCDLTGNRFVDVTAATFHSVSKVLAVAFSTGVFVMVEIPSFAVIHSLRVSDLHISTVSISPSGDWLALGCGKGSAAQLVVWEWQSESYVMKQQSHSLRVLSSRFSPDGSLLATAAEDGKVKVWNCRNGFCVVTFDEHSSAATALAWTQSGKAIVSASLDGTVRARDLKRYRNFRTLVCPEPQQLSSLAVDSSGDVVIAAAREVFQCFIWSLQSGQLLDVLSGHSASISSIALQGNSLASVSWDKTVRMWNIVDSSCETVDLTAEGVAVAFSPCSPLLAVLSLDSTISFFHSSSLAQTGIIEARADLDAARLRDEVIKKETSGMSKSFTRMSFSPDGMLLLVGGQSVQFCLYSVENRMLLKKFTLTINRSLDGVVMDVTRRQMSEFGNMAQGDFSDSEDEGGKKAIQLAGTRHSDKGERAARPVAEVHDLSFCPTGRRFCVSSPEGVSMYSLDRQYAFDPFELEKATTKEEVLQRLEGDDFTGAIKGAIQLSEFKLLRKCVEGTPLEHIDLVSRSLSTAYVERLTKWMSDPATVADTKHVHFYMRWVHSLLRVHASSLKAKGDSAILTGLQQSILHHYNNISSLAARNKYSLEYLINAKQLKSKVKKEEPMEIS